MINNYKHLIHYILFKDNEKEVKLTRIELMLSMYAFYCLN